MGFWDSGLGNYVKKGLEYGRDHSAVGLLYKGAKKAKEYLIDEPADEQRDALDKAGKQSEAAALGGKAYAQQGLDQSLGQYGQADSAFSNLYGQGGQLAGPGYLEKLYEDRAGQIDPYYDRLKEQGTASINQENVNRGSYNSGAALSAIGNYQSGLNAAELRDRADLAGKAQGAREQRLGGSVDRGLGIGAGKGGLTQGFYGMGLESFDRNNIAAIEAALAKSGITGQQRQKYLDAILGGAQLAGKAFGAG